MSKMTFERASKVLFGEDADSFEYAEVLAAEEKCKEALKLVVEYQYHDLETDPTDLPPYSGTFLANTTHGICLAWFIADSKEWNYKKQIVKGWWKLPTKEGVACGQI